MKIFITHKVMHTFVRIKFPMVHGIRHSPPQILRNNKKTRKTELEHSKKNVHPHFISAYKFAALFLQVLYQGFNKSRPIYEKSIFPYYKLCKRVLEPR